MNGWMKPQQPGRLNRMKRCDMALVGQHGFEEIDGAPHVPALPILIFRAGLKRSVRTLAILDTGFDMGLLLSRKPGTWSSPKGDLTSTSL